MLYRPLYGTRKLSYLVAQRKVYSSIASYIAFLLNIGKNQSWWKSFLYSLLKESLMVEYIVSSTGSSFPAKVSYCLQSEVGSFQYST